MDVVVNSSPTHRFIPGKELLYSLKWKLDGFQNRTERFGEEKNLFPLPEFEPWIVKPVA